ncbi:hypothetical protein IV203_034535 [Nitzschia inconspicua]|uniref:Uncharacterized protein n=1 Tax=Nitzschia inconspicua TaxID=303405 RepID=A0A9K3P9T2_9STRA|nr:hypothetical protein IV203_002590 [Nitzschia inconspicua]KAG7359437.1 hypothetical protein IV203_034535 [Nitzschia inconspicua]
MSTLPLPNPKSTVNHRMCQYENLCFHLTRFEFVNFVEQLASSPSKTRGTKQPSGWHSSTIRDTTKLTKNLEVSVKPRNIMAEESFRENPNAQIFKPRIVSGPIPSSHFVLDATVIPFVRYQIAYRNPGHHGWQELVSLYTLIECFGLQDEDNILLDPIYEDISDSYYRGEGKDMMDEMGSKLMGHYSYTKHKANPTLKSLIKTPRTIDRQFPILV